MSKKNFWIAVGGGFIAGIGTALIASTLCFSPVNAPNGVMPEKIEMMKQVHHAKHHPDMRGHKGKHFGKPHHGHFGKRPEVTAEMREHFAKKLGLTDEQKAQLDKFRDEDMAKMEPLFKQMGELHAKMEELRKVNRAHFESVLTDEQKEILKTMKPKHENAPVVTEEIVVESVTVEETAAPAEATPVETAPAE